MSFLGHDTTQSATIVVKVKVVHVEIRLDQPCVQMIVVVSQHADWKLSKLHASCIIVTFGVISRLVNMQIRQRLFKLTDMQVLYFF